MFNKLIFGFSVYDFGTVGLHFHSVTHVSLTGIRPAALSKKLPAPTVGGLRRLATTLNKLTVVADIGARIIVALTDLITKNTDSHITLKHICLEDSIYIDEKVSRLAEQAIRSIVDQHSTGFSPIIPTEECRMNTRLLHLWQFCAKDPDDAAISWLHHGEQQVSVDLPLLSPHGQSSSSTSASSTPSSLAYVSTSVTPLSLSGIRPAARSKTLSAPTVGGLRRLATALNKLPLVMDIGSRINMALSDLIVKHPYIINDTLKHIGLEDIIYLDGKICTLAEQAYERLGPALQGLHTHLSPQRNVV
jgi:hypothetical protein